MVPYFNILVLGGSAVAAIAVPDYFAKFYGSKDVLVVDWGIYALTLVILLMAMGSGKLELVLPLALIFCYLASIAWNVTMYVNGQLDPGSNFAVVAITLNAIAIIELGYIVYLANKR